MRRTIVLGVIVALAAVGTATPTFAGVGPPAAASAQAAPHAGPNAINLPRPTGPHRTGTTLLHLRDDSRIDPIDPQGRTRELMAQIWYPARSVAGTPFAPYAPAGEIAALQATYPVPPGAFDRETNSRLGAPVARGRHEVVLWHHGLCASRTDNTVIAEQLASLGYVVVALASTHESPAVEFPGGRVETTSDPAFCLAGGDPWSDVNRQILQRLLAVRVADVRFTLDQLERIAAGHNPDAGGAPLPDGLAGSMDLARVGMFGHSFGGGTTAAVMSEDRRVSVGVNLDGLVAGAVETAGLDRPFLTMGSDYHDLAMDPSWANFLPRLTGWHKWVKLVGAGHYRFVDLGGSAHKWGLDVTLKESDPETWRTVFGDVDDARSQQIVTRMTTAMFDRFLRHRFRLVLTCPNILYPHLVDMTSSIPAG